MPARNIVLLSILALLLSACTVSQQQTDLDIEKSTIRSSYATVAKIDPDSRMVTLRDPVNNPFTIHVSEEVNLGQVDIGDRVMVTYAETVKVRRAQPGEVKNTVSGYIDQGYEAGKPAATRVAESQVSAVITAIDLAHDTATLQMADGSHRIVKVEDPSILRQVQVGESIVITFQEAVAITVHGN